MGREQAAGAGYGQMAATEEGDAPPEETGAGPYEAEYPEAAEANPGRYRQLAHPDEGEKEPRMEN
jgi:hypothetical protein